GLDPRTIKYVLITHAHGDHDQGAALLQSRYGAKVVMGSVDWDATLQRPETAPGSVPKRDIAVGPEGLKIMLGGTTVEAVSTPGHSPGTLSYLFPVKDGGRTLMVAYSAAPHSISRGARRTLRSIATAQRGCTPPRVQPARRFS
ncbi:MAG: hypothetical protein RLZZ403_1150, partial [Pseudomonadota bacterium]